jgi:hypothetical protein
MKLERFNQFNKFIEFDQQTGTGNDADNEAGDAIVGIGDIVGETWVAITFVDGVPQLHIGKATFLLGKPDVVLQYGHNNDGTSYFRATDSTKNAQIIYPSWWHTSAPSVAAFGRGNDDDEDFCAYSKFMGEEPDRIRDLAEKYAFHGGE